MRLQIFRTTLLATSLAALAVPASAALVDFQIKGYNSGSPDNDPGPAASYTGAAAIGSAGDFWNSAPIDSASAQTVYSASHLQLVDGATPTSVGLTVTSGDISIPQLFADYIRPSEGTFVSALQNAYFAGDDTSANNGLPKQYNFTINGLTAGNTYDLYFYSQAGPFGTNHSTFSITSAGTGSTTGTADSDGSAPFTVNNNYVHLTFTPSISAISGTLVDTSSNFSIWNGFQLQGNVNIVPEPATLTVLAGLIPLVAFRRGKSRG